MKKQKGISGLFVIVGATMVFISIFIIPGIILAELLPTGPLKGQVRSFVDNMLGLLCLGLTCGAVKYAISLTFLLKTMNEAGKKVIQKVRLLTINIVTGSVIAMTCVVTGSIFKWGR